MSFFILKTQHGCINLYQNFGQQILQEKCHFKVILNLDIQTGFDHILKTGSGSATLLYTIIVKNQLTVVQKVSCLIRIHVKVRSRIQTRIKLKELQQG